MQLSEHFSLSEMTRSDIATRLDINNVPPKDLIENLKRLTVLLEAVRSLVGKPIRISSGYRCEVLNAKVKGQPNSQHTKGAAADFEVSGMSPSEVMAKIYESGLMYDQLILEFNEWVHISIPNNPFTACRKDALIIDKNGKRKYG
jgi:zinc D-Ala-D-Ala carboxypeptidase